jgi:hypothetical protein
MRILIVTVLLAGCACGPASQAGGIPEYGYEVVRTYPHDPGAFTQGLFYLNGFLYEGTGLPGESSIRKVRLETGEVLQKRDVPDPYFGEGIIAWKDRLLELTWQAQAGFIYDLGTFAQRGEFQYPGEGWGLTSDGKLFYIHPLAWGLLKRWKLVRSDKNEQKEILRHFIRLLQLSGNISGIKLYIDKSADYFQRLGVNKREFTRSVFRLGDAIRLLKMMRKTWTTSTYEQPSSYASS